MSIPRPFRILSFLCLALLAATVAGAQSPAGNRLASAKVVKCTFPIMTLGNWNEGGDATVEVKKANVTVGYDNIDVEDGTARLMGAYGNIPIIAKLSAWSLHFLEMSPEGTLRLTTVFDRESRPGKFKAMHTRHEYTDVSLPGFTSRPEVYVGECDVEK